MPSTRYNQPQLESFAKAVFRDGYCVLRDHFSPATLDTWRQAFVPLLQDHVAREGKLQNRGSARYYVTLPFAAPFADPSIYEDDDILALIVELLVGKDAVVRQLATDRRSSGQTIKRAEHPRCGFRSDRR